MVVVDPVSLLAAGGVALTALAGRAVFRVLRHRSRIAGRLTAAARKSELREIQVTPGRWGKGPVLAGRWGKLEVYLESERPGHEHPATRIVIGGLGPGSEELSLRPESLGSRLLGGDVKTGDPDFDKRIQVQGPAPLVLALLDSPTRKRVRDLLQGIVPGREGAAVWASVEQGVLEVRLADNTPDLAGDRLAAGLKAALAVARQLVPPDDIPHRLANNIRQEREAGVRLQRLLALVREYPDHPGTRKTLLLSRQDPDDEVCLQAGLTLGDEGLDTLHRMAENGATSDPCAARAIAALGDRLTTVKVRALLESSLRRRRKETALACIEALGRPGRGAVQKLLLKALADDEAEIATAAARALGRVGTTDEVGALRAHADGLLPTDLRAAARQAIAEIQARQTGAGPGQLSLAGGEAGALSLASGTAGALSVAGEGGGHGPAAASNPGRARRPNARPRLREG